MTTDLLELAARCEAAEGPDRELDEAIWEALGNCNHKRTEYYCIEDGNDTDSGFTCLDCRADTYGAKAAPAYTASLDAAMTLVPENFALERLATWPGHDARCVLWGSHEEKGERWHHISDGRYEAEASTPALALCAAALRARAQTGES